MIPSLHAWAACAYLDSQFIVNYLPFLDDLTATPVQQQVLLHVQHNIEHKVSLAGWQVHADGVSRLHTLQHKAVIMTMKCLA